MLITGRIDVIIKNKKNETELMDFKALQEEGLERIDMEFQLRLYQYALRHKYKINRLAAYTFKDNKKKYYKSNDEVLFNVEDKLKEMAKNIADEKFEPKKNAFCSKCTFKFCCKAWR
jgi:DNA helicase-2/ATP-dependent DNA helicase PcrA